LILTQAELVVCGDGQWQIRGSGNADNRLTYNSVVDRHVALFSDVFGHCDGAVACLGHTNADISHHDLRLVDDTAVAGGTSNPN
jgi:hypothetical protein